MAVNSENMQNIRGNRATKSESVNKMQMSERFRATKKRVRMKNGGHYCVLPFRLCE